MSEKIGFEDFVLRCWAIDDSGWQFSLISDQWWEMLAISETLGRFRAVSEHALDVESTLANLLENIEEVSQRASN